MAGQHLLDDGVHGRDVLGHDEGLTVGHIVQGGAGVARQDDLQGGPRLLVSGLLPSMEQPRFTQVSPGWPHRVASCPKQSHGSVASGREQVHQDMGQG
jgi:hypothetical protein